MFYATLGVAHLSTGRGERRDATGRDRERWASILSVHKRVEKKTERSQILSILGPYIYTSNVFKKK